MFLSLLIFITFPGRLSQSTSQEHAGEHRVDGGGSVPKSHKQKKNNLISGSLIICLLRMCRKWTWKYFQLLEFVVHSTSLRVTFVRTLDPARLNFVLEPFAIHTVLRPWSVITRNPFWDLVLSTQTWKEYVNFRNVLEPRVGHAQAWWWMVFSTSNVRRLPRVLDFNFQSRGFNAKTGGNEMRGLQICPHRQPQDAFTNMVSVPYHAASQWGEWDPNNPPLMIEGVGRFSLSN